MNERACAQCRHTDTWPADTQTARTYPAYVNQSCAHALPDTHPAFTALFAGIRLSRGILLPLRDPSHPGRAQIWPGDCRRGPQGAPRPGSLLFVHLLWQLHDQRREPVFLLAAVTAAPRLPGLSLAPSRWCAAERRQGPPSSRGPTSWWEEPQCEEGGLELWERHRGLLVLRLLSPDLWPHE